MVDSAVRAMTWNIWWRFGPRWQDRQPGIRQTLERLDPDVVALQEVWSSAETTQADEPSACEKTPARQSRSTQDEGAAQ